MSHTAPYFYHPQTQGWNFLAPIRSLARQGKHSHRLGQSDSFPRALFQLLPLDGRLQMGSTSRSLRPPWFCLRPRPCLEPSLGHVSTKKELDCFFFFCNPFQGSLQVELGYVISLIKKLPAGLRGGLYGEDGLKQAQCCFGGQHSV